MHIRLILAIIVITLIFWWIKRLKRLPQEDKRQFIIKSVLYSAIAILLIGVITGRLHWIGAIFAIIAAGLKTGFSAIIRFMPFLKFLGAQQVFSNPVFNTRYLKVTIDISQGKVTGVVTDGPHKGGQIEQLSMETLAELEKFYGENDKKSQYLIRVVMQRNSGQRYQQQSQQQGQGNYPSVGDPSYEEALQILGLPDNPSKQDVQKAHKTLMQKLHPDRGGNDYLASRVNVAKEVVIKHLKNQ